MGLLEIPTSLRPVEEDAFADLTISPACQIEEVLRTQMQSRLSSRQRQILERHVVDGVLLVDLENELDLSPGRAQQIFDNAKAQLKQSTELKGLKKLLP